MGLVVRAEGRGHLLRFSDGPWLGPHDDGGGRDDADRFLRSVVSGRPLSRSVMQAAANFGTSRCVTAARRLPPSSSRSTVMRTACSLSSKPLCSSTRPRAMSG